VRADDVRAAQVSTMAEALKPLDHRARRLGDAAANVMSLPEPLKTA
jgi:hypothetical protein